MSVLDSIFIGVVVAAILFFIGTVYFLVQFAVIRRKIQKLSTRRVKNKKKKQLRKRLNQLKKKKRRSVTSFVVVLLLTMSFSGGSFYISYYQSRNLTTEDSDLVVKGYYLLRDFEEQLLKAGNQEEDEIKIQQNIRYLAATLASYGTKKASNVNSKEGQLALNRYYTSLMQIGMNTSTQTKNFFANMDLVGEFLNDADRIKEYEKAAFEYYQVDESALLEE